MGSPPPFYGLKGLVSVYISLNFCTWTTTGFLPNGIWKVYCTCLKFAQNIIIDFPMSLSETWTTMESGFTCYAVPDKTNGTVTETWILPFYFYSTFPWARETIKSNVKIHTNIKKYTTLQSHLNITCESRYWSEMAFAITYYVATCILEIFYSFNVTGRLSIDCWFIPAVIVSIFDIRYRAAEVGIHKGVCNDL